MAKKLTGLAEELKQLASRCDVIDEWQDARKELVELDTRLSPAYRKLYEYINRLRETGAPVTGTEDLSNDPTVQKSLRDIQAAESRFVPLTRRLTAASTAVGALAGGLTRLIAKADDLVGQLPELKPVTAVAKEMLEAVMELRRPENLPELD